ncbi:Y-family DNA polymerase [Arachidicoccus terrestris]|uniref:Y-family DNA polymerase n=1 Tax=Arachidicoccus terrestris TaxID=2875539 RepID=UPI001CC7A77E|nr:DNA polymerase Y family protein [Arachidicoccus terrestris]UAY56711.1 DNA polymerase Y family protein [Arachidicoccus terrestris]
MSRFMSIWFGHLLTDGYARQSPHLQSIPFVVAAPEHGRMVIRAANLRAEADGIAAGKVLADARAIFPDLQVVDAKEGMENELLLALGEWCLRYTPDVTINPPDGLILNISGCPHLWGGERNYLKELVLKLRAMGYDARAAIADTIGAAWAHARYGKIAPIIESGRQKEALLPLPPLALRLDQITADRLHKLGLHSVAHFIDMPRPTLRRRFGQEMLIRIDQALGTLMETMKPIRPIPPYEERLPCLDPVRTAKGIEIAIQMLLTQLCQRLFKEDKGLRAATLTCYRVDNEVQQISFSTSRPSRNVEHLFSLFTLKIPSICPALGIELFLLEATVVEELTAVKEMLWNQTISNEKAVAELLDKIGGKIGIDKIHRYLPDEHYLPEHSYKEAANLQEKTTGQWCTNRLRPICLLPEPEQITVAVPTPDYPPFLLRYKDECYQIVKADGPERIEQQWWEQEGPHRDYYSVEDADGARYWIFRSGHYNNEQSGWFLHGFFA